MGSRRKSEATSVDLQDNLITVKEEEDDVVPIQEKTETEDSSDEGNDAN